MLVATYEQIHLFEGAPAQINSAIEGRTDEQLHHRPAPGEWSIHEVVIHLADADALGYWRLRKTIAEPGSTLPLYAEELWAQNLSYQAQSRELALATFAALRASTAALLRSLPASAWEYQATHPENGIMSIYDLFQMYLEHTQVHLAQIGQIKSTFL
ncbi:MAG TPA: DinB family protein [Ktedonosporobacter sp.]|nr:DinB family protein [Ktedonosporobacter sp.]